MTFLTVDTDEYEASHARRPRGRGRWLFRFGRNGAWLAEPEAAPLNSSYTEATQWARREARTHGYTDIVVCP